MTEKCVTGVILVSLGLSQFWGRVRQVNVMLLSIKYLGRLNALLMISVIDEIAEVWRALDARVGDVEIV